MKKILLLGAAGMAGHVIHIYLSEQRKYEILSTVNINKFDGESINLNIYDKEKLNNILNEFQPDVVINCIGILIRGSKEYPDNAIYANAYFPHLLSRLSAQYSFKLIHISTDCVFSGKDGNYCETSFKDAKDLYGQSKALGEIIENGNLTIRTSIIGPEIKESGEGLFDWFMKQTREINGYKSNLWSGVTTLELAKFIRYIVDEVDIDGLFHLTNNQPISKYDLLSLFNKVFNKNLSISDKKDYNSNKSLVNTNLDIKYIVPSYLTMVKEQKEFMITHMSFYKRYFNLLLL